jgi:PilZ domain
MFEDADGVEHINQRRARRVGFELPVRCKHGLTRSTVMLKDMTTHGARIDGIPRQRIGESVLLFLPELSPKTAFVVWSEGRTSGLEFEHPLHENVFANLVADFAIGHLKRLEKGRPETDAAAQAKSEAARARHAA